MTKLDERPVTRETAIEDRGKPLVVALHPRFLVIRPKGSHQFVTVSYDAIYDLGRKLAARHGT